MFSGYVSKQDKEFENWNFVNAFWMSESMQALKQSMQS